MSHGTDRGSEIVYHAPWGAGAVGVRAPQVTAEDTPVFAAACLLDRSTPVGAVLDLDMVEDTPLFDAVPRYEQVRRADEDRLVRTFRSLPVRWQEVLWFTHVEGVTTTEASIYLGTDAEAAAGLADQAVVGLRRAWVADDLGAEEVPHACASALWALCGPDGWQAFPHVRNCERCLDVARRLEDVIVRASKVLLSVALGQVDQGSFARAV